MRKVEYGGRPEFKELAEQARQIGNELYPKVRNFFRTTKRKCRANSIS